MNDKFFWIQWETALWLKDAALGMCKPATRGIWMDALCHMFEQDRSGTLTGTLEGLARICRCSTAELVDAIHDLKSTNAAGINENSNGTVTLINRRMKKEYDARKSAAERQMRHRDKLVTDSVTDLSQESLGQSKSYSKSQIGYSPPLAQAHGGNGNGTKPELFDSEKRLRIQDIKVELDGLVKDKDQSKYSDSEGNTLPKWKKYFRELKAEKKRLEEEIRGVKRPE